jgi:hypothetical protein
MKFAINVEQKNLEFECNKIKKNPLKIYARVAQKSKKSMQYKFLFSF